LSELDGVGEWATTSAGIGDGSDLRLTKEIHFPHSLGLLYSAFTYYSGFKELLRSKAAVVNVMVKGVTLITSCVDERDERKRTCADAS
jgi:predicted NodU family carbamoyl transferase